MKRFEGKKLLELGTTMGSVQMVQYAKDNGAYVIVADIDKPERSAAKRVILLMNLQLSGRVSHNSSLLHQHTSQTCVTSITIHREGLVHIRQD